MPAPWRETRGRKCAESNRIGSLSPKTPPSPQEQPRSNEKALEGVMGVGRTHHTLSFHGRGQSWEGRASSGTACRHRHIYTTSDPLQNGGPGSVNVSLPKLECALRRRHTWKAHTLPPSPHLRTGTPAPLTCTAARSLTHADTPHVHPTIANREAKGRHPQESSGVAQPLSAGM